MDRKLTTIVAMDVVGYSRQMERDEEGTLARLKRFREAIVVPTIADHHGRVVKLMGDGILAEFASVVDAFNVAVEIQHGVAQAAHGGREPTSLQLRIGLHLGDVIVDGDDLYGDGVNVAARLEGLAEAGGIALSRQVYDQVATRVSVPLIPLGPQTVKNIDRPIEAYRVDLDGGEGEAAAQAIRFDDFELDLATFQLRQGTSAIHIEPLVFDFLCFVARNPGRVISRDELIAHVWQGRIVSDATVAGCIKAARKALGDSGEKQAYIRTIRGRGIQFDGRVAAGPETQPATAPSAPVAPHVAQAPTEPLSLVVLPFQVFGEDAQLQAVSDGLVENLTTVLTRVPLLALTSRTSSFALKGEVFDAQEVGRRLGVRYMLEGSLQAVGDEVRANVQLIETQNGFHLWAQQFDRPHEGDVMQALLYDILRRLEPRLSRAVFADLKGHEGELSAGQLLIQAIGLLSMRGWHQTAFSEASALLRQAIAQEPGMALAHAYLSLILALGHRVGLLERSKAIAGEAIAEAERALDLDDFDSNVVGLAACALADVGQAERAIPLLKNALELNPNNGQAWTALGSAHMVLGRAGEAIAPLERGIAISPMDGRLSIWRSVLALAQLQTGDLDGARKSAQEGCQNDDRVYIPKVVLCAVNIVGRDQRAAAAALAEALRVKPDLSEHEVVSLVGGKLGAAIEQLKQAA